MADWSTAGTYILLGFYIDYGMHKLDTTEIHAELKRRWTENIDRKKFYEYFTAWELGPGDFNLEEGQ